jgi:carboxypeptidase family protein/TonB-dependent receptor-like protein
MQRWVRVEERRRATGGLLCLLFVLAAVPLGAQATGGALEGRLTDEQGLALPRVIVTVRDQATGLQRSATSDALGRVRFLRLPIGVYDLRAVMKGFVPRTLNGVRVDVGATTSVDIRMAVAGRAEELTVAGEASLIDVRQSWVGEIVTPVQIENLPLNGRQFGNLAALVPGVGLGFHNDPTKATQYAPQVAGGTGRNINYQVDGGDNNDDTVGGLVQSFPLDAVAEFNFSTQRFRAEYGRSDGGVLSVVTKSGTNTLAGSAFDYFRDKGLNARTETEKRNDVPKGDYRRWQYGGSLGGPIRKDKTHFFLSFERIQQDTTQSVDTGGLFPEKDGVFGLPYRENISVAKVTHQLDPSHFLSVRYGFNDNSNAYGAGPQAPPEAWGTSTNTFHSANASLTSTLGANRTNEFLFQFSYFHNHISANSTLPSEFFPGGVDVGQNTETPQDTLQKKLQLKDDLAWVRGRHELKTGLMAILEPTLQVRGTPLGAAPLYVHLEDSRTSPLSAIYTSGPIGDPNGFSGASLPNTQYGLYVEDTWRATDRLVLDIGVRYDLVIGMAIDQSKNRVFVDLQDAAHAGKLVGIQGLEDFGHPMTEDKNNVAPRVGFTYDARGSGRLVIRGGYGRYYDFGYTNSNVLFSAIDTQSAYGLVYFNSDSTGIKNPDGTFYQVGQPLPPNQAVVNTENSATNVASPLTRQPYTDQVNLGFSLALGKDYAIEVDGVGSRGRELGRGMNLNTTPNLGPYRFVDILPNVGSVPFRVWTPLNKSEYQGVSIAFRKHWDGKLQFLGSYALSKARSTARIGTDEFNGAGLLDATDPFGAAQFGPSRTDARHRVTISGVWSPGAGFTVAPIFRFRSKTPYNITAGSDLNLDGVNYDLPSGIATVMAGRGASFSQLDARVSKRFGFLGRTRLELLAEVFNVYNARNPAFFVGNMSSSQFGQPTAFAGDAGLGEQRLAQLGVRLEF